MKMKPFLGLIAFFVILHSCIAGASSSVNQQDNPTTAAEEEVEVQERVMPLIPDRLKGSCPLPVDESQ